MVKAGLQVNIKLIMGVTGFKWNKFKPILFHQHILILFVKDQQQCAAKSISSKRSIIIAAGKKFNQIKEYYKYNQNEGNNKMRKR